MTSWISNIIYSFWETLCNMSPYLLFGFLVAGILYVLISPASVQKHLGGRGIWPVTKAALFGIPLPLCSCGVIPVAVSLKKNGASRGATTAFLISTPQTGVDSILVTFSILGPVFAIFRPILAFVSGVIGGILVDFSHLPLSERTKIMIPSNCGDKVCYNNRQGNWLVSALHYGFVTLAQDIARPLLMGLILSSLIAVIVPKNFFSGVLGQGIGGMLLMMLISIPLYVCATASVPIAAVLIDKGVSPGAALVFLVTGPATNMATITTLWNIMGRRTTFLYLLTVSLSALSGGLLMDYHFTIRNFLPVEACHWHIPYPVKVFSALFLMGILIREIWNSQGKSVSSKEPAQKSDIETAIFLIEGMKCSHCADTVRRSLIGCSGVESVDVNLKNGEALITGKDFDRKSMLDQIQKLGYRASLK